MLAEQALTAAVIQAARRIRFNINRPFAEISGGRCSANAAHRPAFHMLTA